MASDKVPPWFRGFVLVCIFILSVATIGWVSSVEVKAPLLTLMGGVTIIVTLYPPRAFTMQNAGTLLGTIIAIFGGGYWLIGEMESAPVSELRPVTNVASIMTILLIVYIVVSTLSIVNWNAVKTALRRLARR